MPLTISIQNPSLHSVIDEFCQAHLTNEEKETIITITDIRPGFTHTPTLYLGTLTEDLSHTVICLSPPISLWVLRTAIKNMQEIMIPVGPHTLVKRALCHINGYIDLTEKETAILVALAKSTSPLSKRALLEYIWRYHQSLTTHTLETHMYRLRKKLSMIHSPMELITKDKGYILINKDSLCC